MREHWGNCITHFDQHVLEFIAEYFSRKGCHCFLLAGAGFDPRAKTVSEKLAGALGERLHALFIREERGEATVDLREAANKNEKFLRDSVKNCEVVSIDIFDRTDNAPIGGIKISEKLGETRLPSNITDIVLDMSALSLGIAFPAARILLGMAESMTDVNLHLMVTSNPELDDCIVAEPTERAQAVRGFGAPPSTQHDLPVARVWLPQLASRKIGTLELIKRDLTDLYKVCPILPFPARNPRRADELIEEFGAAIRVEWSVDSRDFMYVSERNPLDSFRSIETLKKRYDKTVDGYFVPQLILSPVGTKIVATGAMMAAIKYDLIVQYVEALRYEIDVGAELASKKAMDLVHVWLHGPIYKGYANPSGEQAQ